MAVDGSDIQIATNLNDKDSLFQIAEGVKPYNLLHLNALYNLKSHTYEDAVVFKRKEAGENKEDMRHITTWLISKKKDGFI